MRKNFITGAVLALALASLSAVPADAAIVKTTIGISLPSNVFAGVPNPIDIAICPKATLSATECESGVERKVTLYANNVKVQTLTTIGSGGVATFFWTPKSSGRTVLKATAAASGSLRALTSENKTVVVKAKTTATSISTFTCGDTCMNGIPDTLDLNEISIVNAGISSGVTKNRKIRLQTLRTNNSYGDETSGNSVWQADIGKYGFAVSMSDVEGLVSECEAGDDVSWNFRFYVDATTKSPAAATKAKWIDIVCPAGSQNSDIQLDVSYSDQSLDYSVDTPPDIEVSVTAPETTQYSIYSEVCLKSDDCTDYDNWVWLDGKFQSDNIFGSGTFTFSTDPGEYGDYWLRIEVFSWVDASETYSDWYTLSLN
jgi:hypothetical protein